jgi:hypothetical protein
LAKDALGIKEADGFLLTIRLLHIVPFTESYNLSNGAFR